MRARFIEEFHDKVYMLKLRESKKLLDFSELDDLKNEVNPVSFL